MQATDWCYLMRYYEKSKMQDSCERVCAAMGRRVSSQPAEKRGHVTMVTKRYGRTQDELSKSARSMGQQLHQPTVLTENVQSDPLTSPMHDIWIKGIILASKSHFESIHGRQDGLLRLKRKTQEKAQYL